MATIDFRKGTSSGKGSAALYGRPVKTVYQIVDLQDAAESKGSALAAGDIIQCIRIPAGSRVSFGGAKVIEATNASTLHFKLGVTGDDAVFVSAHTGLAESATFVTPTYAGTTKLFSSASEVVLTIGTYTGTTLTAGQVAVWIDIADLSDFGASNINETTSAGEPQA